MTPPSAPAVTTERAAPKWEKLPALDGRNNPCLCCPPIPRSLPLNAVIAVGFGDAHASRDGEIVYREPSAYAGRKDCEACNGTGHVGEAPDFAAALKLPACEACEGLGSVTDPDAPVEEYWDVEEVEKLAAADPDHDWRIVMYSPLHGEVYQRHGPGEWNLVEKNEGFA
jgi:hypothetical protein